MSTKLSNTVTRETSVIAEDRELVISLNEDQTISLKRKGMKSGIVSIGIKELWHLLNNKQAEKEDTGLEDEDELIFREKDGDVLISLRRLRTINMVTHSPLEIKLKLEEIITDLLKQKK